MPPTCTFFWGICIWLQQHQVTNFVMFGNEPLHLCSPKVDRVGATPWGITRCSNTLKRMKRKVKSVPYVLRNVLLTAHQCTFIWTL